MKILIAPDSFKECFDAFQVADLIAQGLHAAAARPIETINRPLADGGEGITRLLVHALGGACEAVEVTGPAGTAVTAHLGLLEKNNTAVIEMASAAGLHLVPAGQRIPLTATTRGVGELMQRALDHKVDRILVGLGGSATNDGGAGMAQALGVRLLDADGNEAPPGGEGLLHLHRVDISSLDPRLQTVEIIGACDVSNLLCGPEGASQVYGPQKGASPEMVETLDRALNHFGQVMMEQLGFDMLTLRGGGAAGGLGAGLAAFTGASLRSGIEMVFEFYGDMDEQARTSDLIVSGEGAVDGQTMHGKVIAGVAALAQKYDKPLFVLAGSSRGDLTRLYDAGVTAVFPITQEPMTTDAAIKHVELFLTRAANNLMRTFERLCERRNGV